MASKQLVVHKQLVVQLLQLDTSNFQNGGRPCLPLHALRAATLAEQAAWGCLSNPLDTPW
jgi:hypothetical protein